MLPVTASLMISVDMRECMYQQRKARQRLDIESHDQDLRRWCRQVVSASCEWFQSSPKPKLRRLRRDRNDLVHRFR